VAVFVFIVHFWWL